MRSATSPRFAMRIFLNIRSPPKGGHYRSCLSRRSCPSSPSCRADREQPLAVLHRLAALDVDVDDFTIKLGIDLVHQLHGFDDAEHLALPHRRPDPDKRGRAGLRRAVE